MEERETRMMIALVGDNAVFEVETKEKEIWICINGSEESFVLSRAEADALADIIKKLVYTQ
jgi:hypothetical protein